MLKNFILCSQAQIVFDSDSFIINTFQDWPLEGSQLS